MNKIHGPNIALLECGSLEPHSGARPVGGARWQVPFGQAFTLGSGQAQHKKEIWDLPPVGSPLAGGAIGVGCSV